MPAAYWVPHHRKPHLDNLFMHHERRGRGSSNTQRAIGMHHLLFLLHVDKSLLTEGLREASYPSMIESLREILIGHCQTLAYNYLATYWPALLAKSA